MGRSPNIGMFGSDSGNKFEVIDTNESEVQIRYIPDGNTAWFQKNRFEFSGSVGMTLQLQ